MSARDDIMAAIRRSLRRGAVSPPRRAELDDRLARPRPSVVPERGRGDGETLVERFLAMATEAAASVARVGSWAELPGEVARYLAHENLPARVVVAPALAHVDWGILEMRAGAARPEDAVGVAPAFAGVAETGTLVLLSGPDSPTTLNFLPDTHIVALPRSAVVGAYEDAWAALRATGEPLPRTVNMITGPSRTGDIEQTIQLGAHGPRRLHIVLIDRDDGK